MWQGVFGLFQATGFGSPYLYILIMLRFAYVRTREYLVQQIGHLCRGQVVYMKLGHVKMKKN